MREKPEEDENMSCEQEWHDERWKVVRGSQHARFNADMWPLVESKQQIGRAPKVEYPYSGKGPGCTFGQRRCSDNGEDTSHEIAVRGGGRESRRQRGGDNPGNEKTKSDEAKQHVRRHQRNERLIAAKLTKLKRALRPNTARLFITHLVKRRYQRPPAASGVALFA